MRKRRANPQGPTETSDTNQLLQGSPISARLVLGLAIPALASLAADPLLSLVDTAFVGRLGAVPLAALGVDTAIFGLVFAVFNFLAYATTPLVAAARARRDLGQVGEVISRAMSLGLGIGVVAAVFLWLTAEPLVDLFGAAPEVVPDAIAYLRVRAYALPALLIITAGHGAFRGLLDTRTPLVITVVANVVNALLDPFFIFVLGLGVVGAAWGTVIAQAFAAMSFVVLLRRSGIRDGFRLTASRPRDAIAMLRFGSVLIVRTLLLVGTLGAATATASRVGVIEVAAHQVVAQLWFLLAMLIDALAIAAQALVGDLVGRNDQRNIARLWTVLLRWGVGVGAVLGAVLLVVGPFLASVFTDDPGVQAAIRSVLPIAAFMQPLAAALFVVDGIYMGLLEFRRLVLSTAVGLCAAGVVLVATLQFGWGLEGVWWGITAMVSGRALVLVRVRLPARLAFDEASRAGGG